MISGGVGSAASNVSLQLGSTTTGYYAGYSLAIYSSATAFIAANNNAASFTRIGATSTSVIAANCDVLSPNLAKNTFIGGFYVDPGTGATSGSYGGFLNDTTAYTGFTIGLSGGTMTGGTIRVYGYKS
jgi:hypothetical protein